MTRPYTPSLYARETGKNAREFVRDNKDVLWRIAKPVVIGVLLLTLLDTLITIFFFSESSTGFGLFGLLSGYFYAVLAITWHRVVIHGPDNYEPMNMFKPKRHEWAFIGMGLLLGVMGFVAGALGGLTAIISPVIGFIAVFAAIFGATYLGFKFCFYFPAKAVDNSITLKQSFSMTAGYFWKMMGAWFFGLWRIGLLMMVVFIAMSFIIGMLIQQETNAFMVNGLIFLMTAPILAYFYPIMYGISITILSNYYQHALQNKPVE